MKDKVAIIIPNGNMSEMTHKICGHIRQFVQYPYELIVVNNPSSDDFGRHTLNFPDPIGMTKAILEGMSFADTIDNFFAFWVITTSTEFIKEKDYLTPMVYLMKTRPDVVMVSASTKDMAWDCMKPVPGSTWRSVWGVDNICLLIRKDWFDGVGRYDPQLTIGWGPTLETCWKARRDKKDIVVMDNLLVKWHDGIAHKMDRRWGETREEHNKAGAKQMEEVFIGRYGKDWLQRLNKEYKKR